MASVNDYGADDAARLDAPPLGGPDGWAAAVAAALSGSDVPMDTRLAAKVNKAGDTMTGPLYVQRNASGAGFIAKSTNGSAEVWTDRAGAGNSGLRVHVDGKARWLIADDGTRLVIARYNVESGAWLETAFSIDGVTGETSIARTAEDVVTPASGWKDYGTTWAGLKLTKVGKVVTMQGLIQRAGSTLSVTNGSNYTLGTIPAAYRPSTHFFVAVHMSSTGATADYKPCRVNIASHGAVELLAPATETLAATAWVGLSGSWRAG